MRWNLLDLKRFGLFLGLWLILTRGDAAALVAGVPVAAAATLLARRVARDGERALRLFPLLLLFPGFVWRSLLGGIDVGGRAFARDMRLNPGWVRFPSDLPEGAARIALASTISLMPGTLAAGEDEGGILVHCLDVEAGAGAAVAAEEARLRGAVDG